MMRSTSETKSVRVTSSTMEGWQSGYAPGVKARRRRFESESIPETHKIVGRPNPIGRMGRAWRLDTAKQLHSNATQMTYWCAVESYFTCQVRGSGFESRSVRQRAGSSMVER